jgi:hypothetical protein
MSDRLKHERLFVLSFVVSNKRARLLEMLESEKKRWRFEKEVWELRNLGTECQSSIAASTRTPADVVALLRKSGAGVMCRVVSPWVDDGERELEGVLAEAVPNCDETLISCVAGKLAFWQDATGERILFFKK